MTNNVGDKFRTKPVDVLAWQYKGPVENKVGTQGWTLPSDAPSWLKDRDDWWVGSTKRLFLLGGQHIAHIGDWIIKGGNGEIHPCNLHSFEQTYEAVEC